MVFSRFVANRFPSRKIRQAVAVQMKNEGLPVDIVCRNVDLFLICGAEEVLDLITDHQCWSSP